MFSYLNQIFVDKDRESAFLFLALSGVILISLIMGITLEMPLIMIVPMLVLVTYLCIVDFRLVFYLLLICVPLSTEYYFNSSLATDLPTEPLMVSLMLVYVLYALRKGPRLLPGFLRHPITILLFLHLGWIFISAVNADSMLVSVKFMLAKTWYVITFYFLAAHVLRKDKHLRHFFMAIFIPLVFAVLFVLARHSTYGFSFGDITAVMSPFFRNHVNYAAILSLFTPYICLMLWWYKPGSSIWWTVLTGLTIVFVGIYFSYTRAASVSLVIAIGAYFVVRMRIMKIALLAVTIGLIGIVVHMVTDNTYMEYAPNFERTVSHKDFDKLVEATYKMEDISTMERLYRWVAGFQMITERPVMGFGPGNFYNYYKPYAVTSFTTYVSDNPERSGIHSYYLMTMVEQGIPGMLIFILLNFYILIRGEAIYHHSKTVKRRLLVMMNILCIVVISAFLLINDMIETDKVGPFFFMSMAMLVNADLRNKVEG